MQRIVALSAAGLTGLLLTTPAYGGGASFDRQVGALNPQACGGAGCWTNHLRVTDLDNDGDLDIIFANYPDFFGGSAAMQPLVIYQNDGAGNFTNVSMAAVNDYSGQLRQIAVGDVDGDGFRDIYAPSGDGSAPVMFINDGTGNFTDEAAARLPGAPFPAGAATRMGDVDNDGDLDIFAADGYAVNGPPYGHIYLNDGLGVFTELAGAVPDMISGIDIDDVELFDADRDFDLDIFVNAHNGGIGALWLNDGTGMFAAGGTIAPPATGNNHYNAAPCDVDGDGDLDMWIENIGGGFTEQLQINDGMGNFTDETGARVSGNPGVDDNGVVCADIDDDGDFDAVVLSLNTAERFLENDGTGNFTYVPGVFPTPSDGTLWGEFGDLNGDDRFDLVTGQGEITNADEVYFANDQVPVDAQAPKIIVVEQPTGVTPTDEAIVRFAVSDRSVTDEGPRLTRAYAVIDPAGAATEVDAPYMGGDLFRAVLPAADGTVTFQACAQDVAGNVGCSDDVTYDTSGVSDSGGSDSGMGDTTGDPTTGTPTTGADATDGGPTSGATANQGSSGDAGTDTDPGATDDGGSGCGCRTSAPAPGWAVFGLFGAILLRRRRRG